MKSIRVILNQQEYALQLDDNETSRTIVELLPLTLDMHELNSNEKYAYLNQKLPTDAYYPKTIQVGDVMLYGDNCLVIFYKSLKTEYPYTKIGHIDNLPKLGKAEITVQFHKV